jgi:hypothetical protein
MAIPFIHGRKVGIPSKYAGSKKGDPLITAKTKAIDALNVQKGYARNSSSRASRSPRRTAAERGAPGSIGRSMAPTGRRCAIGSSPFPWKARTRRRRLAHLPSFLPSLTQRPRLSRRASSMSRSWSYGAPGRPPSKARSARLGRVRSQWPKLSIPWAVPNASVTPVSPCRRPRPTLKPRGSS